MVFLWLLFIVMLIGSAIAFLPLLLIILVLYFIAIAVGAIKSPKD